METKGKYCSNENPIKKYAKDLNKCWNVIIEPWVATCLIGLKFIFFIKVATRGPDAPNMTDIVEEAIPPKKIYFLPSLGNFPNSEYKINKPTPIWPKAGDRISTTLAPKKDPIRVPPIKGRIILISRSFNETKILAKFEPNWIIPCTGTKATGGIIKDKLTSINNPPPKLNAVEIHEHSKFMNINAIAPPTDIVLGKYEVMISTRLNLNK